MEQFSSAELRDYLGVIRDTIADGQARGVFRSTSPTLGAKVLFGALDEMATNWILSRRRYALTADADAVVDLFLNGVTGVMRTVAVLGAGTMGARDRRSPRQRRRVGVAARPVG